MRTVLRTALVPVFVAACAACGGENPQPVTPPPTAPGTAPVAVNENADLTPVAEPPMLVSLVHWKSAQQSLAAVTACGNLPAQIGDVLSAGLVQGIVEEMLHGGDAKSFQSVVALDAPMDAAVVLDDKRGNPRIAVAIGLSSVDGAKSAADAAGLGPVTQTSPGVWSLGKSGSCVIAASSGATPARLVCSKHIEDAQALAPYLTRTVTTMPAPAADLHAEVRFAPLEAKFGPEMRGTLQGLPTMAQTMATIGEPKFDRAVVEAAGALRDEANALLNDADRIGLDLTASPQECFTSKMTLQMKSATSWFAGVVSDSAAHQGQVPAIYWRLPKDADAAFYGHGSDPKRSEGILRVAREMVDGLMDKYQVGSAADRKAVIDLLSFPSAANASTVTASGHADVAKPKDKAKSQELVESAFSASLGWHIIGTDQPADVIAKELKDVVAVANRSGIVTPLKKKLGDGSKYWPNIKTVAAPAQLGKGAVDVEVKVVLPDVMALREPAIPVSQQPAKKPAAKAEPVVTVSFHVLLMADGNTTWIAFGTNRDELVKHLLVVKSGAPDAGTIATRPGLERLKSGQDASGGFLTIQQFTHGMASGMGSWMTPNDPTKNAKETRIAQLLASLPHHGETPIFLTTHATGAPQPRLDVQLAITKPTVEDLTTLIMELFKPEHH